MPDSKSHEAGSSAVGLSADAIAEADTTRHNPIVIFKIEYIRSLIAYELE